MKISKLLAALPLVVSTSIIFPLSSNAADGTITFNGKITEQTCTIATGGNDFTVTLPTVAMASLSASSSTAGRTPFSINLTECPEGKVATYFEPGTTVDLNSGRLNNQSGEGAATNVQVRLLGDNNQFIPIAAVGSNGAQQNSQWVTVDDSGTANLNYYAEYYSVGSVGAGTVNTSVQYTLIYQ